MLTATVPSNRWVGCGSLGDALNSPLLSPLPCLQSLPTIPALLGVVERKGGQAFS